VLLGSHSLQGVAAEMEEEYMPWIIYPERRKCEGVHGIM